MTEALTGLGVKSPNTQQQQKRFWQRPTGNQDPGESWIRRFCFMKVNLNSVHSRKKRHTSNDFKIINQKIIR